MFENVVVEDVIKSCTTIAEDMIDNLNLFEGEVEKLQMKYVFCSKVFNSDELRDYVNNVAQVENKLILEARGQLEENSNYLEKLNREIEDLKTLELSLKESITKHEKDLNTSKAKILNLNKKKENLLGSRDVIQICKLLTNTSFTYKESTINGYAVGENSKKISCFELDPEKLSQSEITNSLYKVVKEASVSGSQDRKE